MSDTNKNKNTKPNHTDDEHANSNHDSNDANKPVNTCEWLQELRKTLLPAYTAMKENDDMNERIDKCLNDWQRSCEIAGIHDDMTTRAAVITFMIPFVTATGTLDTRTIPDSMATLMIALLNKPMKK